MQLFRYMDLLLKTICFWKWLRFSTCEVKGVKKWLAGVALRLSKVGKAGKLGVGAR
jgi:hypothetical protein